MRRLITATLLSLAVTCALAGTQMQDLAMTLHPTEFPDKVEQLFRSGNNAAALELAELGLKKNPQSLQLRFMRANALERLGRTEEARKSLTEMIEQYPEIPDPYNNLARLEAAEGRLETAARLLHRALLINPDFALARKNLGDVYLALARECYEKASPQLPSNRALSYRLETIKRLEAHH
ncbi:TPR repeat-containing protein [gut metagenome]|uniref:TPR repeat-containing protein n=1 Tax=gut metagenome TaxID=749906 RepID=J9GFG2_9ZZZZ